MKNLPLSITEQEYKEVPEKLKKKVLSKNDHKCSACNIELEEKITYFHNIDKNTVIPMCGLCYYPLHLERLSGRDQGRIIMFQELSQVELNSLVRGIEFVKMKADEYEEAADSVEIIETVLKERAEMADVYYASGVSNVDLVVQKLYGCSKEDYDKRENGFYSLRWLPEMENFRVDMEFWAENSFKKYLPDYWPKLIQSVANKKN